jgi:pyruvate carboxylase
MERMGAHILAIKDMAGLCKPLAAIKLIKTLKQEIGIPIHFHTHDSSGIASSSIMAASQAGVDVVDLAIASMSGSTSQPNLNSIAAALRSSPRDTGLDQVALDQCSTYWEGVRGIYAPFDTSPPFGSAEVYFHEMPGGQYTNLKEQASAMGLSHRWPEIVRCYAEVNQLFGDIVKVTPSSKVVGDMAMFLITKGIKPEDVVNLDPQVHDAFLKHQREFGDVSVLPSAAFFYGLQPGEEITVEIEEGKVLIIRLVTVGEPDKEGRRIVNYELNGMARDAVIADKTIAPQTKARPKADPADPAQVAAPIPGLVAALAVSPGAKVAKGDKLLLMEAMKMQTTVYAPLAATVTAVNVAVGDTVEAKDLLIQLRPAE